MRIIRKYFDTFLDPEEQKSRTSLYQLFLAAAVFFVAVWLVAVGIWGWGNLFVIDTKKVEVMQMLSAVQTQDTVSGQLKKIKALHEQGIITDDKFARRKSRFWKRCSYDWHIRYADIHLAPYCRSRGFPVWPPRQISLRSSTHS